MTAPRTRRFVLIAVAASLFGLGVASARSDGLPVTAALVTTNIAPGQEGTLPPQRQLEVGQQAYERMKEAQGTVRAALEKARAARDVVKTLCLTDKLNQMEVATRTARDRVSSLAAAVQSNDTDRSRHETIIVLALRDRVEQLAKEANQCIGEEAGFIGQSDLDVEIDPNIPKNDPDQLGADPGIVDIPPDLSSPTY